MVKSQFGSPYWTKLFIRAGLKMRAPYYFHWGDRGIIIRPGRDNARVRVEQASARTAIQFGGNDAE